MGYGMKALLMLERDDKWYLGGGKAVIWAPEFAQNVDAPGFWDHAAYLEWAIQPIFTVTILDEELREIPLRLESRSWLPSHLTQIYKTVDGLKIIERKAIMPNDTLTSVITLENLSQKERHLNLILWTFKPTNAPEGNNSYTKDINLDGEGMLTLIYEQLRNGKPLINFPHAYGASLPLTSYSFNASDGAGPNLPLWEITPFYEKIRMHKGILPRERKEQAGIWPQGIVYLGLQYKLVIPPRESRQVVFGCALAKTVDNAKSALKETLSWQDPIQVSVDNWVKFFESVPNFSCSDPYIEKYYWYRWYGIRLNMISVKDPDYHLPYVCISEGTNCGWFRKNITYSAQVHILECRWMHDPQAAQGSLLNFIYNQRSDGSFVGGIPTDFQVSQRGIDAVGGFYHGDWGRNLMNLYYLHPDDEFLKKAYDGLVKYAEYFDRERDKEGVHLYDVINQWETGEEFMSRYQFVDERADYGGRIQLKGIDATVYIYGVQKALSWMAEKLGKPEDAKRWQEKARATREAILKYMWDPEKTFFYDVHPKTLQRSPYKAAVCFYPFLTDIATREHIDAIYKHLLNEKEFWTPFPIPSTSVDDPYFSAEGEWKGKRHHCPWNGRSWLMTTSHVCECLANAAYTLDENLKPYAADYIKRYMRMLFKERDLRYPTSYEYYNPYTGQPPVFRGVDDYMHSYIVDLIIRYVAGIQPQENKLVVDPLPLGEDFRIERVYWRGHFVDAEWNKSEGKLRVWLDGKLVAEKEGLSRIELTP